MTKLMNLSKLKNPKTLGIIAMLLAMDLVLNMFRLRISDMIEINFNFLALMTTGMLFGPGVAIISGAFADILGFMLSPSGTFFPGFTLNAMVAGLIYGIGFYHKSLTLPRIIIIKMINTLVVSFVLTPIWLNILYQAPLITQARLVRSAILLPIQIVLAYFVLTRVKAFVEKRYPQWLK